MKKKVTSLHDFTKISGTSDNLKLALVMMILTQIIKKVFSYYTIFVVSLDITCRQFSCPIHLHASAEFDDLFVHLTFGESTFLLTIISLKT